MPKIKRDLTPGEQQRTDKLVELAKAEFGDLSEADEFVVRCAAAGEAADFTGKTSDYQNRLDLAIAAEKKAISGGEPLPLLDARPVPSVSVSAAVVRWLLIDSVAEPFIHTNAIRVRAVRFNELLSLSFATAHRTIILQGCILSDGFACIQSRCRGICLSMSSVYRKDKQLDAIEAGEVVVEGSFFLREGFRSEGEIHLTGASVRGDVDCSGGIFNSIGKRAISLEGTTIAGNVLFKHGFYSEGEVSVAGSKIQKDLVCHCATFNHIESTAFSAERTVVEGSFIRSNTRINGVLNLTGSRLGALLDRKPWPSGLLLTDCVYEANLIESSLDVQRRLEWLALHDKTEYKIKPKDDLGRLPSPQPYQQLARVLRKQGREHDAARTMQEFARLSRKPEAERLKNQPVGERERWTVAIGLVVFSVAVPAITGPWWAGLIGLAAGVALCGVAHRVKSWEWWLQQAKHWIHRSSTKMFGLMFGFGYARWNALVWIAGFILISAGVFGLGDGANMQPAQPLVLKEWNQALSMGLTPRPESPASAFDTPPEGLAALQWVAAIPNLGWVATYPAFNSIVYSADAFVPLVSLHQEEYWTPSGSSKWGWFVKNIYLPFHIATGWVITTLFAASFTRLMRHEE